MLSLVVVTYNRLEYTRQCLESIFVNTDVDAELIVVDNGSTDGTVRWLADEIVPAPSRRETRIKNVVLKAFEENRGCAEGYNEGFGLATGDPVFRIDNDVILPENWASAFMFAWMQDPRIGMLTTNLETEPRTHPENVRASMPTGICYFSSPVWHDHGLGSWCMAHRRAMFKEIGYYDTRFGLIVMNDTDLQKRAEQKGWKAGTVSGITVGHLWQMASEGEREYNLWKIDEQAKNVEVWIDKWGPTP